MQERLSFDHICLVISIHAKSCLIASKSAICSFHAPIVVEIACLSLKWCITWEAGLRWATLQTKSGLCTQIEREPKLARSNLWLGGRRPWIWDLHLRACMYLFHFWLRISVCLFVIFEIFLNWQISISLLVAHRCVIFMIFEIFCLQWCSSPSLFCNQLNWTDRYHGW